MSHIADRFTVILDANVLYPYRKRDILLWFYHAGLFRARWSKDIVDEWTRSLIEDRPDLKESLTRQQQIISKRFPEALVEGYEPLISGLSLPDFNDRHVLAAAIKCDAQHIITDNLKDFPNETLEPLGIEAISADEFLYRTFELYDTEALKVMRDLRNTYNNPSFSPPEFIMDLTAKGLPKLAASLRELSDFL